MHALEEGQENERAAEQDEQHPEVVGERQQLSLERHLVVDRDHRPPLGGVSVAALRREVGGPRAEARGRLGIEGVDVRDQRGVVLLTPAGQQRVAGWLTEVSWPRPDLAEFHLKLIAAAAARLADPLAIVDAQRRELLRRLRDAQRAAMAEPDRSPAGLLLEGIVLRLQADLRWLESCERCWTPRKDQS